MERFSRVIERLREKRERREEEREKEESREKKRTLPEFSESLSSIEDPDSLLISVIFFSFSVFPRENVQVQGSKSTIPIGN